MVHVGAHACDPPWLRPPIAKKLDVDCEGVFEPIVMDQKQNRLVHPPRTCTLGVVVVVVLGSHEAGHEDTINFTS